MTSLSWLGFYILPEFAFKHNRFTLLLIIVFLFKAYSGENAWPNFFADLKSQKYI
jgi:hypothetical protein